MNNEALNFGNMSPKQQVKFNKIMAQRGFTVKDIVQFNNPREKHLYSILVQVNGSPLWSSFAYDVHSGKLNYMRQGKQGFARQYHKLRI